MAAKTAAWRLLLTLSALLSTVVAVDNNAATSPNSSSPDGSGNSALQLNITNAKDPLNLQVVLVPLTSGVGLHQSPSHLSLISISGLLVPTNETNFHSANNQTIAYLSCDGPSADPNETDSPDVLLNALMDSKPKAIVLYSQQQNFCSLSGQYNYSSVLTTADSGDATTLLRFLYSGTSTSGGPFAATIRGPPVSGSPPTGNDTTTSDTSGTSTGNDTNSLGNQSSGQSAVAMSILYSITGLVTILFLVIIATGAIRAHRHPERYGPRRAMAGLSRQSRARGIAMAVLDTIPIVKFRESNANDDPEAKLSTVNREDATSQGGGNGERGEDGEGGGEGEREGQGVAEQGSENAHENNAHESDAREDDARENCAHENSAPENCAGEVNAVVHGACTLKPRADPDVAGADAVPPPSPASASPTLASVDDAGGPSEQRAPAIDGASPPTEAENADHPGCSICTEDFVIGEDVRVLPCNHKFHPACVDPWLLNVSGTCPLCRMDLRTCGALHRANTADETSPEVPNRPTDASGPGSPRPDDGLPPPLEPEHAEPEGHAPHRRRMSHLFGLGSLRHVPHEERISALRQIASQQRATGTVDANPEEASRRTRLASRLRDSFRIRTRAHPASEQ